MGELEGMIAQAQDLAADLAHKEYELEDLEAEKEELQSEANQVQSELDSGDLSPAEEENARERLDSLNNEMEQKDTEIDHQQRDVDEAQRKVEDLDADIAEVDTLKQELDAARLNSISLGNSIGDVMQKIDASNEEMAPYQSGVDGYENNYNYVSDKHARDQAKVDVQTIQDAIDLLTNLMGSLPAE